MSELSCRTPATHFCHQIRVAWRQKCCKLIDGITALDVLSGHESQEASNILKVCVKQAKCYLNVKSIEGLILYPNGFEIRLR